MPLGAPLRRGDGLAVLFVEDDTARLRSVAPWRRNERFAQIVVGCSAGERVVTHPSYAVSDGTAIVERQAPD